MLSGCCATRYDPVYIPPSSILLNLDHRHNGFAQEDTLFKITSFEYGISFSNTYSLYSVFKADSLRTLTFYSISNTEKLIIESLTSNFKDTLTGIGYNSREVQVGSKRCGYFSTEYFNTHAIYKGQNLSSGESSTLEIHITK